MSVQAEAMCMEAISACEALVGLVHPHTLGAMEALVFVLRQARYPRAAPIL